MSSPRALEELRALDKKRKLIQSTVLAHKHMVAGLAEELESVNNQMAAILATEPRDSVIQQHFEVNTGMQQQTVCAGQSQPEPLRLLVLDPYLKPWESTILFRHEHFNQIRSKLEQAEHGLEAFSRGYQTMGLVRTEGGFTFREWAPLAQSLSLVGDFNGWNQEAHRCTVDSFGVWSTTIPDLPNGSPAIQHNQRYKVALTTRDGSCVQRIPAWAQYSVQETDSVQFNARLWRPPTAYTWQHPRVPRPASLLIYEAHVGLASELERVGTYNEFTERVLPHIAELGYTAVQFMAIMEHSFYGSFGYHVTNFFAVSSRCGTPDDFRALVDRAHGLGLYVIIDVVHSHASNNTMDGLNQFDGSDHQYFHEGSRGRHDLWDSRLFNYASWEVLRFLLSNLRFWVEEYRVDGFRFDGVTSMIYNHHGIGTGFSGNYNEYYGEHSQVDLEALTYLKLANHMMHSLYPNCITIAEEVSGMPGLCRPVAEGGVGFDYRMGMAVPDLYIKLLKEIKDEDWNMGHIAHTLINRRRTENTVAYCECHDQCLVGDKTIAFWLMDAEMYVNMSVLSPLTPVMSRGLALHKMFRLLTIAMGGEAYLNFMGNEFGHPEWVDFPRHGNNFSYKYARRQWGLIKDPLLRYKFLNEFDHAMICACKSTGWLATPPDQEYMSCAHEDDKVIVFERGNMVFLLNFHASKSFADYRVGVRMAGSYRLLLSTDSARFDGHSLIDESVQYLAREEPYQNRPCSMLVYLPSRVGLALIRV